MLNFLHTTTLRGLRRLLLDYLFYNLPLTFGQTDDLIAAELECRICRDGAICLEVWRTCRIVNIHILKRYAWN